ncbi:uncharacterized protein J4E78_004600 [Alternaria triticimaculans]|uniref:uncharacterized protein n=2 Tax=Alternaria sect. Infectoriae TaxID=2499258 RepID=UPI0020C49362|nr:uncharacterized protein J4E78_004600 [Alternaria triticimaculans]KAI4661810.1 hypothetical protein J4E78_004600 [Alternaria triticimaculans]
MHKDENVLDLVERSVWRPRRADSPIEGKTTVTPLDIGSTVAGMEIPFSISPTMGNISMMDFPMIQDARYLSSPSQDSLFVPKAQPPPRLSGPGFTSAPHNSRVQKTSKMTRSRHNAPGIQDALSTIKAAPGASGSNHVKIQKSSQGSSLSNAPQTKAEQQALELKRKSEQRLHSPEPVDIESRILELLQKVNRDDRSRRPSKSEKNDALLKMMAELVNKGPRTPDTEQRRSSKSSSNNDKTCPMSGCEFAVARDCDLRKHIKRHNRPYGCTYPKCHKRFGAKSDWKRHENSQHFQQEAFRCGQELQTGQVCGVHLYREGAFKNHLEREHKMACEVAQERVNLRRIGKNCQGTFWCGLCKDIVRLKERRNAAWDERFDHIARHFEKERRNIDDWICAEENRPKKELLEEKKKRDYFDDEDERDKDGDVDAPGDVDDDVPQPHPSQPPPNNMPKMPMSSHASMRPSPLAGDIALGTAVKRQRSEDSAYGERHPKRRQKTLVTNRYSLEKFRDAALRPTTSPSLTSPANMAAAVDDGQLLKQATGRNTRGLLRVIILCLIAAAAVSSRLFSVIRFESIIHEFDPWFNFRATKYLVQNGFYSFWDWFDDRTWHPLGRVTGGTLYPGLMVTSGVIYHALRALAMPVDIRNICVLLAPAFSGLTALATYLLTSEMVPSPSAGLLAAAFMGITPGYISRSVAGSYDNEAIAIFLLVFTFFLWIKAVKLGSMFWGALTALFYGYMVSAWGGYVFITNLLPLHAFVLICMGRYSPRLYVSYTSWYALGTLASMQIPFVGFLPIRSSEHMSALGVFGLLQLVAFVDWVRAQLPGKQFQTLLRALVLSVFLIGVGGLVLLTVSGVIAPWTGRFYSLWDTGYAKIHIPIIASVSEHQPTAWPAFFFDLNMMIWLFPAGVYLCFRTLTDEQVFIVIYAVLASYFAGVMVRLMLTLTPIVCVASAIAFSQILDTYLDVKTPKPVTENGSTDTAAVAAAAILPEGLRSTRNPLVGIYSYASKLTVAGTAAIYLMLFVLHCTWVTSNAYSSPSVVLASRLPDGSQHIIDDYREAYYWLRQNTPQNAKIMSWWDYGYQIGGMADRPTLVDNNTWNNTHIATVGKAMSSREEVSYPIMRQHEVDYVLVVFGGLLGYSGDDINKFLWMVRIAEGIWPDEVKERNFFTPRGEYRVDEEATPTMKNSLMYKMSYYNYNALFPAGQAQDRVRGARLPAQGPELSTIEEAFTSENWIIRIYKVKDLDNFGRDHQSAVSFDKGHKKKRSTKRKGPRVLRVE